MYLILIIDSLCACKKFFTECTDVVGCFADDDRTN